MTFAAYAKWYNLALWSWKSATNETLPETVNIYPNPVYSMLYIVKEGTIENIRIYSAT